MPADGFAAFSTALIRLSQPGPVARPAEHGACFGEVGSAHFNGPLPLGGFELDANDFPLLERTRRRRPLRGARG
jgi:hypothetical protein